MSPKAPARPLLGVALISLLAVAACGSTGASPNASDSSDAGVTVKVGQFSWTAAELETEILSAIVSDYPQLGVSEIEATPLDPAPGWVGLGRGDVDVLVEVNLPNQQAFADEQSASTELVSETYGGAVQGWFVPRYLVESGGAAEGLKSVDQLADKKWSDAVAGVLYDADPGWVTTQQNEARIEAFGLQVSHQTSSEAALIAQLKRSYERKEPVLIYFYRPHWLFAKYDLVQLEEPKPYADDCFGDSGRGDCAIPTLSAWTAINKDLTEKAPKFAEFLKNFQIPLEDIEKLLAASEESGTPAAELAKTWVADHKDEVEKWVG